MNKSAIKAFATSARTKLIEDIAQKAYELGIEKDGTILPIEEFEGGFKVKGRENAKIFKKFQLRQRKELVEKVSEKGVGQVVEEVAYTWFNRFIAIRFMEINGYLPTGVRVLSSEEEGKVEPDMVTEALNIDIYSEDDKRKREEIDVVYRLQDSHDTEELFKFLLVKQCNKLSEILPGMFEEIEDFTEVLLPEHLLGEGGVVKSLVESIDEDDFRDQVEIIGWLYQYYISEKKNEVFAGLKKNKKITKENIPAATQLFTPKWIVKYMVENSLGRLWQESHPDDELKSGWKYYIEEAQQEEEVRKRLDDMIDRDLSPEDIKFLDPAMGSGHILVYAFDVLYDIYDRAGYSAKEIPKLILEKNLYGLDIDDRAGQLAYFALMMRAASKNRRILRKSRAKDIKVNVCAVQESNGIPKEVVDYLVSPNDTAIEKQIKREDIEYIIDIFQDAKEYGSILDVKPVDFDAIERRIEEIEDGQISFFRGVILEKFLPILEQAKIMSSKYDVVVTNPPYMGRKGMNPSLVKYLDKNYKDSKSDLFAVFMESCLRNTKKNGFHAMINQHSWMFLSSYEKLREKLINTKEIQSMIHLGPRAFEEIGGEVVQSTTFVMRNSNLGNYEGQFIRVVDENTASGKEEKTLQAIQNLDADYRFKTSTMDFSKIPGSPIAYWASEKMINIFLNNILLGEIAEPKQGMATTNNALFLRKWFEILNIRIGFDIKSEEESISSGYRWFPYNKGGDFRKWYGNNEYVVNFENGGKEVCNYIDNHSKSKVNHKGRIINRENYFKKSITWSFVSSSYLGVRYSDGGFIFDIGGSSVFPNDKDMFYLTALLCSKLSFEFLKIQNPTLNFQVGNIANIPVVFPANKIVLKEIDKISMNSVELSKLDWDSFETSWDFETHPILRHKSNDGLIESSLGNWAEFADSQFNQLKENEEELNRVFIDIYGLQDELTPEVEDKDITVSRADREREVKSLISYAVGCMFGRYSLDEKGLVYAGGDFDMDRYSNFVPARSNVIPIVDDEYFEDCITNRFVEFVKVAFGEDKLSQNLEFIAQTLGIKDKEMPKDAIRRYFIKDFYKDHVKTYKKRPIYWQFDSGKQGGFKALIYMHRYDSSTVARVRTDYLHALQKKYESKMKNIEFIVESDAPQREKNIASKELERVRKQQKECMDYDQVIAHVANDKIEIDLDDGVKVNYMKFQEIELSESADKKSAKANLLSNIKL